MRPRLLDLFSGAGGAAKGYQQAGFHVTGVDLVFQPNYCGDEFHQADALTFPLDGFDAIHASPPCQDHSTLRTMHQGHGTGWMLNATVERLTANRAPWIVENVEGAHMPDTSYSIVLCGSSFGLRVRRHRRFASNVALMSIPCDHRRQGQALGVYGHAGGANDRHDRGRKATAIEAREAMGIDWMTHREIAQAIPPAYTEYLGGFLINELRAAA